MYFITHFVPIKSLRPLCITQRVKQFNGRILWIQADQLIWFVLTKEVGYKSYLKNCCSNFPFYLFYIHKDFRLDDLFEQH